MISPSGKAKNSGMNIKKRKSMLAVKYEVKVPSLATGKYIDLFSITITLKVSTIWAVFPYIMRKFILMIDSRGEATSLVR